MAFMLAHISIYGHDVLYMDIYMDKTIGNAWRRCGRQMNMADEVLQDFITFSPSFCPVKLKEHSYPVVGSSFSGTSFSLDYYEQPDGRVKVVLMKDFFERGLNSLRSEPSARNAQVACQQLRDFLSQSYHSVIAKLKEECKTEEFNCVVATEVLIPLSSGYCLINRKTPNFNDKRLKLPNQGGVKGLGIGFSNGYHGEADMVVVPECDESGTVLVSGPVEKEPRIDEEEENSTSACKDVSPGKSIVEGKNAMHDSLSGLSQCIATIITFAQIQIRRHPEISYPIPMLRVDPEGVVVLVYDYPSDVLMISQHIGWSGYAFIAVWLTLHYSLFPSNALSELSDYCCGYSATSHGISLGDPWYLVSPRVFSESSRRKLIFFKPLSKIFP